MPSVWWSPIYVPGHRVPSRCPTSMAPASLKASERATALARSSAVTRRLVTSWPGWLWCSATWRTIRTARRAPMADQTIVEFIRQQLDEDERVARAAEGHSLFDGTGIYIFRNESVGRSDTVVIPSHLAK